MSLFWKRTLLIGVAAVAAGAITAGGIAIRARAKFRRRQRDTSAVDFTRDVQPILSAKCLDCHGAEKHKGGLRLDERAAALTATNSGEVAIVPGDPEKSALISRIISDDPEEQMPPKGDRLVTRQIEILRSWIDSGAHWSPGTETSATVAAPTVTEKDREHWAYHPLSTTVPTASKSAWATTTADQFIVAAQDAKGLQPNPIASRGTLIRRLYFDLIGLPPSPEEIAAFEADASPGAYEKLVDRLLADPRYGERWGRHWLDAARYADSAGYEEDRPRPDAWRYRDFVIRAFHTDLPYDRFIQWQIAGDLLEPNNPEVLAATGFITAAPDVRPDFINFRKKDRCDELDDIVATTGSAILGLTLGCARCHDHKFDPISMTDYYRLTAFFTSTERVERPLDAEQGRAYNKAEADYDKRLKKADKERRKWITHLAEQTRLVRIAALPIAESDKALLRAPKDDNNAAQKLLLKSYEREIELKGEALRASVSEADRQKLDALENEVKEIDVTKPADIPKMLIVEEGKPQATYLLSRGDPDHPGAEVSPGMITVLSPAGTIFRNGLTRADLARWLTDSVHGAGNLTARVAVNRLWQHHFGRGLVETPGDFGLRGDPPALPGLLDWLASELIRGGWKISRVQKLILMSSTYRQDVTYDAERAAIDPANHLWWRREPLRLEAETLRDSILAISGELNPKHYGPSVKPHIDSEAITVTNPAKHYDEWPHDVVDGPEMWRRSIYIFTKRANLFPFLQAFDAPNAIGSCTRRNPTTVAPQSLALLNDTFVRSQARAFANRLSARSTLRDQLPSAFQQAFGRAPTSSELSASESFVETQSAEYRAAGQAHPETAALTDFCQALFAANEFSFVD